MACPERYGYDFQKKKVKSTIHIYVKSLCKVIIQEYKELWFRWDESYRTFNPVFFSFLIISSMSLNAHYLKMFVSGFNETSVSRFWRSWKWEKNTTRNTFCFTCFHVKNMKKVVLMAILNNFDSFDIRETYVYDLCSCWPINIYMFNTTSSHYVFRHFDIQHKHPLLKKNKFSYIKKDSGIIASKPSRKSFCFMSIRLSYTIWRCA